MRYCDMHLDIKGHKYCISVGGRVGFICCCPPPLPFLAPSQIMDAPKLVVTRKPNRFSTVSLKRAASETLFCDTALSGTSAPQTAGNRKMLHSGDLEHENKLHSAPAQNETLETQSRVKLPPRRRVSEGVTARSTL